MYNFFDISIFTTSLFEVSVIWALFYSILLEKYAEAMVKYLGIQKFVQRVYHRDDCTIKDGYTIYKDISKVRACEEGVIFIDVIFLARLLLLTFNNPGFTIASWLFSSEFPANKAIRRRSWRYGIIQVNTVFKSHGGATRRKACGNSAQIFQWREKLFIALWGSRWYLW